MCKEPGRFVVDQDPEPLRISTGIVEYNQVAGGDRPRFVMTLEALSCDGWQAERRLAQSAYPPAARILVHRRRRGADD
jgi:hypothetical protein